MFVGSFVDSCPMARSFLWLVLKPIAIKPQFLKARPPTLNPSPPLLPLTFHDRAVLFGIPPAGQDIIGLIVPVRTATNIVGRAWDIAAFIGAARGLPLARLPRRRDNQDMHALGIGKPVHHAERLGDIVGLTLLPPVVAMLDVIPGIQYQTFQPILLLLDT